MISTVKIYSLSITGVCTNLTAYRTPTMPTQILIAPIGEPSKTAWRRSELDAGKKGGSLHNVPRAGSVAVSLKVRVAGTREWNMSVDIMPAICLKCAKKNAKTKTLPIGPWHRES